MADRAETDLRSRIAQIRGECVAAFGGLGERLGDVRQGLDGVAAQVSGLVDLLGALGVGTEPRGTITGACTDLAEALERARAALGHGSVIGAIRTAVEALDAIARQAKQLTAVSSITCVTARSTGAEALGDYVVSLRQMTDDLAGAVQALGGGLGMINLAHAKVLDDIATVEGCVARAVQRIGPVKSAANQGSGDRAGLESRLVEGAARLAEAASRETGALIVAMQFSDSLAQRLEHVEAILAGAAGCEGAAHGLAAAQLTTMAEDAASTLEALSGVLKRLAGAGADAAEALTAREGIQVEALLTARRADLSEGTAMQALVVPALAEAHEGAARIRRQIDAARDGYARLTETATGVNLSAINATLLTARGGAARAAMAVLSEAVRGSARDCSDQTGQCRAAMAVLEQAVRDAGFEALAMASTALRDAIGRCADALAEAEGDLTRLHGMRDQAALSARALVEAIGAGEASLSRAIPAIDNLRAAARGLGSKIVPGDDLAAQLERFAALYTMPREREVHARFCGLPSADIAPATQDMADIFF